MNRRLFKFLTGASLFFCAATIILWIRTYWANDQITLQARYGLSTYPSAIQLHMASYGYWSGAHLFQTFPPKTTQQFQEFFTLAVIHRQNGIYVQLFGFAYSKNLQPLPLPACWFHAIYVPLWFPLTISLIAPTTWLWKRQHVLPADACANCGYDLRATPNRCPECGTIAKAAG